MENATLAFKGEKVTIDNTDYVLPAIPIGALRKDPDILSVFKPDIKDDLGRVMAKAFPMILASFRRNYPEMTEEKLDNMLDTTNFNEVWVAVLKASNMYKPPDEVKPEGAAGEGQPRVN